jgi:hypothetical protein
MTNAVEIATNTVNVVTSSRLSITPVQLAYNFKEWAGVVSMIVTSVFSAFHLFFPRVQGFLDTRDGGWIQGAFYWCFGRPKITAPGKTPPPDNKD